MKRHSRFLRRAHTGTVGTSEIGLICGVCSSTAARWIDRGFLPGFREPSRNPRAGPRRVRIVDLLGFVHTNMPHRIGFLTTVMVLRQAQYGSILDGDDAATGLPELPQGVEDDPPTS